MFRQIHIQNFRRSYLPHSVRQNTRHSTGILLFLTSEDGSLLKYLSQAYNTNLYIETKWSVRTPDSQMDETTLESSDSGMI